ncbi:MAG: hypothetical protein GYA58_13555 [Anaerolineaceae bacterium]|jgi:hypothetical protein|nr:hypothetical protein [Anaerolineaceae bacterium]
MKRKLFIGLLTAMICIFAAVQVVQAGTTSFDVLVPRLGGTANTNVTTKSTSTQQWAVYNIAVGANKTVSFRPYTSSNSAVGSWVSGTTGSQIYAPYSTTQSVGALIYLRIKTAVSELVTVEVSGTFDSY